MYWSEFAISVVRACCIVYVHGSSSSDPAVALSCIMSIPAYHIIIVFSEQQTTVFCRITTEFLEKGAYVEADVIRQVKQLLPEDLAANIQEPDTPASRVPEEYERPVAPISSSTGTVVTELPDDVELN